MNLIQSVCCFFSSRCASGAEPKKADRNGSVETPDMGTAPPPRRPATPEAEVASGDPGVERALRPRDLGLGHLTYLAAGLSRCGPSPGPSYVRRP
jgi:hypothetical protein